MAINFNRAEFVLSAVNAASFVRDGRPQVTFAGRSNVGKSSVINRILNRKNFARVGATPGKTTQINYFRIDDKIYFTDLPGYGYAKVSGSEKRRWMELIEGYFNADRDMRLVLQLLDIRHTPSKDDYQMLEYMVEREIPFVVVLTKADKLNKTERAAALAHLASHPDIPTDTPIIFYSSLKTEGKNELWKEIYAYTGL
jgi:GTP-binding protein